MKGTIICITGCMFCGKGGCAREVIQFYRKVKKCGGATNFKSSIDSRGGEDIIIRNYGLIRAKVIDHKHPEQILHLAESEIILIDDAHFFTEGIVETVVELRRRDKIVIINGLDTDFRGLPFHPMPEIMEVSNCCVFPREATCALCGEVACRTQKLTTNGAPALADSPLFDSGGEKCGDKYEPRCLKHHQPPNIEK